MNELPTVQWAENGATRQALWRSESGAPAPRRIVAADDTLKADAAWRLACEGTAILWRGDFHNARQLLRAMGRRFDKRPAKPAASPLDAFNQHRMRQGQRARTLGMLLVPVEPGHHVALRRAPDVGQACLDAYGPAAAPYLVSLRELLGLIGAAQWQHKGVPIAALDARIHPRYGVFSPVRGEYVDLVANTPLPAGATAFDIGTGTGVLAAVLARRGLDVTATDLDPRALACAADNLRRLGLDERVRLLRADLFPPGRADLVVCNPPWLPARPSAPVEYAIYDPDSRMLTGWLAGLAGHLNPGGEGWLILSDLAEHLGLRSRDWLLARVEQAGLRVAGRVDTRPVHPRASDPADPLHAARAAEVTSLWRLAAR